MAKVLSSIVVLVMVMASVAVISASVAGAAPATSASANAAAGHPAPPASGSISLTVTTFARDNVTNGTSTLSEANGGSFGSGATLYVCYSNSQTFNAATAVPFGAYTLPAGATSMSGAVLTLGIATEFATAFPNTAPASGYIAITDNYLGCGASGATYTSAVAITFPVSASPIFQVVPATEAAGSPASVIGSGWDAGATVTVTLVTSSSSSFPQTYTADALGDLSAAATLAVPTDLAAGTYNLVATETGPTDGASYGITVVTQLIITPTVVVAQSSINGNAGNTLTLSGYGFPAGAVIKKDWITVNTEAIPGYTTFQSSGTTHVAVTITATGQFGAGNSLTVTLNSSINSGGGGAGDVNVFYSTYIEYTQAASFFVSNPNPAELALLFSPTSGVSGDPLTAQVWNWYPAGSTVTIYMGSTILGTISTDSFGYGTLSTTVPELGGGTYIVRAVSSPYSTLGPGSSTFTIASVFQAIDSAAAPLQGEYVPSNAAITIEAYSLDPNMAYTAQDYQVDWSNGIGNVTAGGGYLIISISVGSPVVLPDGSIGIVPAANGTIVFTYAAAFGSGENGTSSDSGITFSTATGAITYVSQINAGRYNYSTADNLYQSLGVYYKAAQVLGGLLFINETDLIPAGASAFYPGITNVYNFYWGTTELANKTGGTDFTAKGGSLGSAYTPKNFELVLPKTLPDGPQYVSIVYAGTPASDALDYQLSVGSLPGTSVASGTIYYVPGNDPYTYPITPVMLAYNLQPNLNIYVYISTVSYGVVNLTDYGCTYSTTSQGVYSSDVSVVPANGFVGAYVNSCPGIAPYFSNLDPAGTYVVWLMLENATTGATNMISSTFSVVASAYDAGYGSYNGACYQGGPTYGDCDYASGQTEYIYVNGLDSVAAYDVYLGGSLMGTFYTDPYGGACWESSCWAFSVPAIAPGVYTVSIVPSGDPLSAAVAQYPIVIQGSPTITLFTGGTDQSFAFPSELLAYNWTPASTPTPGIPVTVTVLLNGTPYMTQVAMLNPDGSITGSFEMPNSCSGTLTTCSGTYWWVTLQWSQEYVSAGSSNFASYTEPTANAAFLQVVVGNGALLTGVSEQQIAEITTAVSQTLMVPLAELNAAVMSINNATVEITTAFGNMTTTLAAINATVQTLATGLANVENGTVQILTTLGTVTAALSALGAQVTGISGAVGAINGTVNGLASDLVTVQTSLGTITTTLTSIDATVTATATSVNGLTTSVAALVGSVATIQTTLGTITGMITAVNTSVDAALGGLATIQTTLGTITVTVNQIQSNTSGGVASQGSVNTATYLLYAVLGLVVLVLILIALLIMMAGRMRPPMTPPAPYAGPSDSSSSSNMNQKGPSGGGSTGGAQR